jgi:hypothetical protein
LKKKNHGGTINSERMDSGDGGGIIVKNEMITANDTSMACEN